MINRVCAILAWVYSVSFVTVGCRYNPAPFPPDRHMPCNFIEVVHAPNDRTPSIYCQVHSAILSSSSYHSMPIYRKATGDLP